MHCDGCDAENSLIDGICNLCGFSYVDEDNLKCPICGEEVEIHETQRSNGQKSFYPECDMGCEADIYKIDDMMSDSEEVTKQRWIELCKNFKDEDYGYPQE